MTTTKLLFAIFALVTASPSSPQPERLNGEELSQVLETAVAFTLKASARYSKAESSSHSVVFDTSSSLRSLRESGVAREVKLSRSLSIGRAFAMVARNEILSCPNEVLSSACTFTKSTTSVWIGKTSRVADNQVSVLVHVMSPSTSTLDRNRISGYSVEVIVQKDQAGRWTAARMGKVVAG
jgi:hypothetical protein